MADINTLLKLTQDQKASDDKDRRPAFGCG